jgi:hypothetical protein
MVQRLATYLGAFKGDETQHNVILTVFMFYLLTHTHTHTHTHTNFMAVYARSGVHERICEKAEEM